MVTLPLQVWKHLTWWWPCLVSWHQVPTNPLSYSNATQCILLFLKYVPTEASPASLRGSALASSWSIWQVGRSWSLHRSHPSLPKPCHVNPIHHALWKKWTLPSRFVSQVWEMGYLQRSDPISNIMSPKLWCKALLPPVSKELFNVLQCTGSRGPG